MGRAFVGQVVDGGDALVDVVVVIDGGGDVLLHVPEDAAVFLPGIAGDARHNIVVVGVASQSRNTAYIVLTGNVAEGIAVPDEVMAFAGHAPGIASIGGFHCPEVVAPDDRPRIGAAHNAPGAVVLHRHLAEVAAVQYGGADVAVGVKALGADFLHRKV